MLKPAQLTSIGILLLCPGSLRANPVPDKVAQDFNALPCKIGTASSVADHSRFADFLGRYGLQLLKGAALECMNQRFDIVKRDVLESQRPGHSIQFTLQSWFRERASVEDREAMGRVLLDWLTATLTEAPSEGGMRTMGPAERVSFKILKERIKAAEALADYGFHESLPEVRKLKIPEFAPDDGWAREFQPLRVALDQTILRLEKPGAAGFLVPGADNSVAVHLGSGDVQSVTLHRYNGPRNGFEVSRTDWEPVLAVIAGCLSDKPSRWGGSNDRLTFVFRNGLEATFSPTESDRLVYTDNSRVENPRIVLRNHALYEAVQALISNHDVR